jgi:phosphate transport system substrate-binding protein
MKNMDIVSSNKAEKQNIFFFVSTHKHMLSSIIFKAFLVCFLVLGNFLPTRAAMLTIETYPRVDGANVAIPLSRLMAEQLIGKDRLKGSTGESITAFKTTHNAYVNLITKKADIIFVFGPSDEELKLAEANNVKLIYSGKVRNWSKVGGTDQDITAYQFNKNFGSRTFIEQIVMGNVPMAATLKVHYWIKDEVPFGVIDVYNLVYQGKAAMGYSFYTFVHNRRGVKLLALDGHECNKESIRNEVYPLTVTLYAVTRVEKPEKDGVGKMLAWLTSEEGQLAVEKSNFVALH